MFLVALYIIPQNFRDPLIDPWREKLCIETFIQITLSRSTKE